MQIRVVDSFFRLLEGRFVTSFLVWQKRHPHHSLSGGGLDLTLIQGQDQDQGQGQDQKWRQRSALQQQMVLALTLTLVLALVRNIIIFSKVRVLVLNQPIIRPGPRGSWGA